MKQSLLTTSRALRVMSNLAFWLLFAWWHFSGHTQFWPYYPALLAVIFISYGPPGYLHNDWLIPRFLLRRRYIAYGALLLLLLAATAVFSYYLTHLMNQLVPGLNYMGSSAQRAMPFYVFPAALLLAMLAFGKFMGDAIRNQRKVEALEKQRLESELLSLRSQVNPHFLFNALNTVYGMARRNDAETAEAIIQLSDILRHGLYECDDEEISVEDEIRFLRQYVQFARRRLYEKERIRLEIDAPDVVGKKLAPLLLMPFVENAIKHGLSQQSYDSWVDIRLSIIDNALCFSARNSYRVERDFRDARKDASGGIGLRNVKRRLELLYHGRHTLDIRQEADEFSVALELMLS